MHLKRKFLYAFALIFIFASLASAAAPGGAVSTHVDRAQRANEAAASLGGGATSSGPGADLRAIASPKKPQTLTGFPAGTLPGDTVGGSSGADSNNPQGRVVFSGDPLSPLIGPEMVGTKLDRICMIAAHVGYTVERRSYSPTSLDSAYAFSLMNGRRRVATLYFDRSMTLQMVQ